MKNKTSDSVPVEAPWAKRRQNVTKLLDEVFGDHEEPLDDDWLMRSELDGMQVGCAALAAECHDYLLHNPFAMLRPQGAKGLYQYGLYGCLVHAAEFSALEKVTGRGMAEFGRIAHFGAGFGDQPRLLWKAGCRQPQVLIDLPEMLRLQRTYLTWQFGAKEVEKSFRFVEVGQDDNVEADLLIATYSLAETPAAMQHRVYDVLNCYDAPCRLWAWVPSLPGGYSGCKAWENRMAGLAAEGKLKPCLCLGSSNSWVESQ